MTRRWLAVGAVIGTLALFSAGSAMAGHSWNGYHIHDHDGPVKIDITSYIVGDHQAEFEAAVADWNDVSKGSPLAITAGHSTGDRPSACAVDPAVQGSDQAGLDLAAEDVFAACNDDYGTNGWLGLARIWITPEGHIEAGVTLMNESYLQAAPYNTDTVWRHVVCQELGHDFGLGHVGSPRKQSCMNDRWGLDDERFMSPDAHDYEQLNLTYGGTGGDSGDGGNKPCRGNNPKCGAGAHAADVRPRPGGGFIVTFHYPADSPHGH